MAQQAASGSPRGGEGLEPEGDGPARPTIGLLSHSIGGDPNTYPLWAGVYEVAREREVNLVCFPGRPLRSTIGFDAQANVLYDLVDAQNVDGLVIWGSVLAHHVDLEEVSRFCNRFRPLPMVNLPTMLEGIPSVIVDTYQGVRDATLHLIEVHGFRRIAFIRGPAGHPGAEDRFRGYADALARHDLSIDPKLVAPGDFQRATGAERIALFLDERGLRPQADFEAVVVANDLMALGAMEALRSRGIRVPADVAVVGFDDIEESRYALPPLTTARLPFAEMGRRAAEIVLAQLKGEDVPDRTTVPSRVIVRRSCGCLSQATLQAAARPVTATDAKLATISATQREGIVSGVVEAGSQRIAALDQDGAGRLLDAFVAEIGGQAPGTFLTALDQVVSEFTGKNEVASWHGVLSALRRHLLSYVDADTLPKAEDLWQQARVVVGETALQVQAYRREQAEQQAKALRVINQALITTFNLPGLMDILAQELPRLGITRGYLSLYEDPQVPTEWSRLILAYDERGRAELESGGQRFPSRQLAPQELLPDDRSCGYVVEPIYFRDEQLGFAFFGAGPREGRVCDQLRGQISSALQGAMLVEQVQSRALQLQTAAEVSRAASGILDLDELIQPVVDLVGERFGLYYVGLFLVDERGEWTAEPGKWAVLRAGTGEAGRQMVAEGYRLEVGGRSIVGRCIIEGQAYIALEADADGGEFANPLLPETRSEMILPLKVGERTIGALDVHSRRLGAFDENEKMVFQTMAGQLAVAVQNARTVADMRRLNENLEQTLDVQARLLETIRQLSTPVLPLMDGVILLPIVGNIDTARAEQIMGHLLTGVQEHRARVAIVDITGVAVVDTAVANSLLQAAQATSLLGAEVVLVGIRPEVAQTIVGLGVRLSDLVMASDLHRGIEYAFRRV